MTTTHTFDLDALEQSARGVVATICPPMAHGYDVLRDFMNREDAPVTVQRLLASEDTDCPHAALIGIMAAILADTTPDDLADFLAINPSLASVVLAFIGVHAALDPMHLIPAGQRVGVDAMHLVVQETEMEDGTAVHAHVHLD